MVGIQIQPVWPPQPKPFNNLRGKTFLEAISRFIYFYCGFLLFLIEGERFVFLALLHASDTHAGKRHAACRCLICPELLTMHPESWFTESNEQHAHTFLRSPDLMWNPGKGIFSFLWSCTCSVVQIQHENRLSYLQTFAAVVQAFKDGNLFLFARWGRALFSQVHGLSATIKCL